MFTWTTGEFSFEIQDRSDDSGEDLFVSPGMNPQFLALEGTRLSDEAGAGGAFGGEDDGSDDLQLGHEDADDEAHGEGEAPIVLAGEEVDEEGEPLAAATVVEPVPDAAGRSAPAAAAPRAARATGARHRAGAHAVAAPTAVVAIDHDLRSLEWLKAALAPAHPRVHIFQRPGQGISACASTSRAGRRPLVVVSARRPRIRLRRP